MSNYLGLDIKKVEREPFVLFSDNAYYLAMTTLQPGAYFDIDFLNEFSVFVKSGAQLKIVLSDGSSYKMAQKCALDVAGLTAQLVAQGNTPIQCLIAGVRNKTKSPAVLYVEEKNIKKVVKPWGHELWIQSQNKTYSLKEIFIKKGFKTSLQYHKHKQETNVVFDGKILAWFQDPNKAHVKMKDITSKDISSIELGAITSIDVLPPALHRIEAITDTCLYEASTPHLTDVIRIQDDTNRTDGHIASEHALQVCILTSGTGSRMGGFSKICNKSLLPFKGKAIISHIIEKFSSSTTFVVALGYMGEQVKAYLSVAHPETKITYVTVDNYDQAGSGPGLSLKQCEKALEENPFFFIACDSIWNQDLPSGTSQNWLGVKRMETESAEYCTLEIDDEKVMKVMGKQAYCTANQQSFTGICFIADTKDFWEGLSGQNKGGAEFEMTQGLANCANKNAFKAIAMESWTDLGTFDNYSQALKAQSLFDFSKGNEFFYYVNGRIIKFFCDAKITSSRVKRSKIKPEIFPTIDAHENQFYSYKFVEGETLYKKSSESIFLNLLNWLNKSVWPVLNASDIFSECLSFYRDKTNRRLEMIHKKYPEIETEKRPINQITQKKLSELLSHIDWSELAGNNIPAFIHGDLQFDNIIISTAGNFTLIDWRQDFGGNIETGDLYYDLAKLYGGLLINYASIKENKFDYSESDSTISYTLKRIPQQLTYTNLFKAFVDKHNYDFDHIRLITAIIFLNMSPLHHYPFDKIVYFEGKSLLASIVYDHK